MKTSTTSISVLSFLILLMVAALAATARATVRIDATVHAPGVHVRAGGPRSSAVQLCLGGHETRVNEHDRRVARRLARYADVSERRILRMKRNGYCWSEIGLEFDLPRVMVQAAQSADSWKHYLRHDRRPARCESLARPARKRTEKHRNWCGTRTRTRTVERDSRHVR